MTTVREKTAIVTGGANGIGFQCCRHLLLNGAKAVAILDLPNSNGETSAKKLVEEFGEGRAIFFPCDVTELDKFDEIFKEATIALNGLDILVNNAGIMNDADWQKEIAVNFSATVKSTLLGYDYMGKHKGGKGGIIVNVSSNVGLVQSPIIPVYAGTKHATLGFTVSMKDHEEETGVTVRVLCPGATDTNIIADCNNKFLDIVDNDQAVKAMLESSPQPVEFVGKALIESIEKGANGSVWVTQLSEPPFEIEVAKYEAVKLGHVH